MPEDKATAAPTFAGPLEAVLADEMQQVRQRLAEARQEHAFDGPVSGAEKELITYLGTLERGLEATHHGPKPTVPPVAGELER